MKTIKLPIPPGAQEIIGAKIGTVITTDRKAIMYALENNQVRDLIDRRRVEMMVAADMGANWERLSNAPTLFYMLDGKPLSAYGEQADQ